MTKARGPGGKNRKKAKGSSLAAGRRELLFAEDGQSYAFVVKSNGDGRYSVLCNDGQLRAAILRGKLWKRSWIRTNDIVLVAMREYQDAKCDVVHKYDGDEVHRLVGMGEVAPCIQKYYNLGEYDPGVPDQDDTPVVVFDDSADDFLASV